MAPLLLYATCAVGAVGLYLILRPGAKSIRMAGVLIGLAAAIALGLGLLKTAAGTITPFDSTTAPTGSDGPSTLFTGLFCLIAVASAVRMITHRRPVYVALYFVLVVVSSAGLFLLLQAEFMAFALVIVYAGAILITYLFVLMLAQQAESEDDLRALAEYDRVPREPATAVVVGLIMVAVLSDALFGLGADGQPRPGGPRGQVLAAEASAAEWRLLDQIPRSRDAAVRALVPDYREVVLTDNRAITVRGGTAFVTIVDGEGVTRDVALPPSAAPTNTEQVGLALVAEFPVSLELAGVILTMAMFGAVVLARRQAELGEDQRREAAGLRRLTVDGPDGADRSDGSDGWGDESALLDDSRSTRRPRG